jgi:hypothetical protein
MEEVWSDELTNPTVLAFLSLVGTSEAAKGATVDVSELEQLRARILAMEKKPPRQANGPPAPGRPAATPGDTTSTRPLPTPADPNSKRSKAKAAAAAAAAGAAPPAAAAP